VPENAVINGLASRNFSRAAGLLWVLGTSSCIRGGAASWTRADITLAAAAAGRVGRLMSSNLTGVIISKKAEEGLGV
jgi:hypothetical protein